jgi:hypothetical protein
MQESRQHAPNLAGAGIKGLKEPRAWIEPRE